MTDMKGDGRTDKGDRQTDRETGKGRGYLSTNKGRGYSEKERDKEGRVEEKRWRRRVVVGEEW